MKIESILFKNFKSFKDAGLSNLPNLCIIVGANGTGKSTIFQVFQFLRDAMASNVNAALARFLPVNSIPHKVVGYNVIEGRSMVRAWREYKKIT